MDLKINENQTSIDISPVITTGLKFVPSGMLTADLIVDNLGDKNQSIYIYHGQNSENMVIQTNI